MEAGGATGFCTECGGKIGAGSKFCATCGHQVAAAAAPTPTGPAATAPRPSPPAKPKKITRGGWGCLGLVGIVLVIVIAAAAGGGKSNSGSSSGTSASSTAPHESGDQKDANSWIKELGPNANRVQASILVVQLGVLEVQHHPESETAVNELAQAAQTAHDRIDEVRDEFANGSSGGNVGEAAVEVWNSANGLKNAMGALVSYAGDPNPATLAHFRSQYEPARDEWNRGVKQIWHYAKKKHPPTI